MADRYPYPARHPHHHSQAHHSHPFHHHHHRQQQGPHQQPTMNTSNHPSNGVYRTYAKRTTSSLTATTKAAVKKVGCTIGHYTSQVGGRGSPKSAHNAGDRRGWRRAVPWKHPDEPPPSSHAAHDSPKLLPSLRGKIPKFKKSGFHLVSYGGSSSSHNNNNTSANSGSTGTGGSGGVGGPSMAAHASRARSLRGAAQTRGKPRQSEMTQPLIPEYHPRSGRGLIDSSKRAMKKQQQTYLSHPSHQTLTLSLSSDSKSTAMMTDPADKEPETIQLSATENPEFWQVKPAAVAAKEKSCLTTEMKTKTAPSTTMLSKPASLSRNRSLSGMSINLSRSEKSYSSSSSVLDLDDSAMNHGYLPRSGPVMEEDDDSPDTDKDTSGHSTPPPESITPVSSLASCSPKESPLSGFVEAPAAQCTCVQRRLNNLCKPRLIIFDWDDTILPTTSLLLGRYQLGLDFNKLSPETQAKMAVLENLAIELLTQCLEYNGCTKDSEHCVLRGVDGFEKYRTQHRLFVVTNAIDSWVEQSSKRYMPKLHDFLLKNNATLASEEDMKRVMQQKRHMNVASEVELPPYTGVLSADKPVNTPGKPNSIRVISASHLFSAKAPHCRNVWKLCTFSEICDSMLLRSADHNKKEEEQDQNVAETMDDYGITSERSVDLSCSFSSLPCETPRRTGAVSGTATPSSVLSPRRCDRSISYSRSALFSRTRSSEESTCSLTCDTPRSLGSPRIPLASHSRSRSLSSSDLSVDFSSEDSSPCSLDESGVVTQFGDLILSESAESNNDNQVANGGFFGAMQSPVKKVDNAGGHRPYSSLKDLLSRVKKQNKYDWDLISVGDACHESNAALMVGSIINENLSHYRSLCTKVVKLKRHPNMADMIAQMMALKEVLPKLFDETDHVFVDDICQQSQGFMNEQQTPQQ